MISCPFYSHRQRDFLYFCPHLANDAMNEKNDKEIPAYRTRLKSERSDRLYVQILEELTRNKRYRDPSQPDKWPRSCTPTPATYQPL